MNTVEITNMPELPYTMEEAINRLRVNIGFAGTEVKKIMIISTFPNEGKSLVSLNLWRQVAEAGVDCLLMDVDMRNSMLNVKNRLKAPEGVKLMGTTNYLAGDTYLEDCIYHTQYEHGDVLFNTNNVINPSMLLESDRFTRMMEYGERNYRYVFLDTPPLDLVSDGELIGSQCDGALLVVRAGSTPKKAVQASINQLERAGCPLLGVVLNRVETAKSSYYYGKKYGSYYGKYYGHYGQYGAGNQQQDDSKS